jgi:hypothetical protein
MPRKSKPADTAALVSDDAIRQRAYYLWEADGRPDGRGDHYWHLAHEEATRALVQETGTRTARASKGKNPLDMPPQVKAGQRANKARVKAGENKPAKKAKPLEVKPAKKTPKPKAAVQKVL